MERVRRVAPRLVAVLFGVSSVVHLCRPQVFEPLVPGWLPGRRRVIYLSGVAEMVCAAALLRRTRWSGIASAVLLAAIFPGNIQMAVTTSRRNPRRSNAYVMAVYARLPVQALLVWAALQATPRRVRGDSHDASPAGHSPVDPSSPSA